MNVVAINGSPRKGWNTAGILQAALEQAQRQGAATALYHLYDLHYTGCRSCFACKHIRGFFLGRCALKDDLTSILQQILAADVVLLGSPIYFGDITASMRALLERLWFPSLNYDKERTVNYRRNVMFGLIFTMNLADTSLYDGLYQQLTGNMERLAGPTEVLAVGDTLQFPDYSQYRSTLFDAEKKLQHHETQFPQEKQRAAQWMQHLLEQAVQLQEKQI